MHTEERAQGDQPDRWSKMQSENARLRQGLERARSAIQILAKRITPGDHAAQHIVDEELRLATDALHPHG